MKDIFREHILRLCQVDSWKPSQENVTTADKILLRVEQICNLVEQQAQLVPPESKLQLQVHINFKLKIIIFVLGKDESFPDCL